MNLVILDYLAPECSHNGRYQFTVLNDDEEIGDGLLPVNYFHSVEAARSWCRMEGQIVAERTINEGELDGYALSTQRKSA